MATFVKAGAKTKAIIRKVGFPTKTKTFTKRSDAIAWSRKIESQIEQGCYRDDTKAKLTTLSKTLDSYYASCEARGLKALRFVKTHVNQIKKQVGDITLSEITSTRLAAYRDLNRRLSSSYHRVIRNKRHFTVTAFK